MSYRDFCIGLLLDVAGKGLDDSVCRLFLIGHSAVSYETHFHIKINDQHIQVYVDTVNNF